MSEGYLDPKQIYAEELQHWSDFWDSEKRLYENVKGIVEQTVLLPDANIMLPVACTYLCVPSKWAKILPILFSVGEKGSGKSTLATFGAKLHGVEIFSAADTFASLRNALNKMRWIDPADKDFEQEGVIMCWDNIHANTLLNDQKIFQMLLFGYSRASEIINIADKNGENISFHVFSPKVMSSIDLLYVDPRFQELWRRLLIIKHKPWEKFTSHEKDNSNFNVMEKLDLDSVSWTGLSDKFLGFWSDSDMCRQYAKYRSYLTRKGRKSFTIPESITGEQWTVSIDLICTGLCIGTWESYQEAADGMGAYWHWANNTVLYELSATIGQLKIFIEEEVGLARKQRDITGSNERLVINPARLKDRLAFLQNTGELDDTPKTRVIVECMRQLGWKLEAGTGWVEVR